MVCSWARLALSSRAASCRASVRRRISTCRTACSRLASRGGRRRTRSARRDSEARLVALACSAPPEGYSCWSLRLLERHVALVEDLPDLDHSTIGRVLKKRNCVLI